MPCTAADLHRCFAGSDRVGPEGDAGPAQVPHHLRRGEQQAPGFLVSNPPGLLLVFESKAGGGEAGSAVLTQSLAIIEHLDEVHPDPLLLPHGPLARACVRAFALAIACGIHPVQDLRVLARPRSWGLGEPQVQARAHDTIAGGPLLARRCWRDNPCCFSSAPGLADLAGRCRCSTCGASQSR